MTTPTAVRRRPAAGDVSGENHGGWLLPLGAAVVATVVYSLVSIIRHVDYRSTGYDLGIFEQAVRGYSELRMPVATLKGPGFNLLGDHFSPIIALAAPAYRLWSSPITLLVIQAALLGVSAWFVARVAQRRLPHLAAAFVSLAYVLSWGLQSLAGFDFHEAAFGVAIVAAVVDRLDVHRYRQAAVLGLALLLVKEDLGLTVLALGLLLWLRYGQRRLGLGLAIAGTAATVLLVAVVIPHFNQSGTYNYIGPSDKGITATSGSPSTVLHSFFDLHNVGLKGQTIGLLLLVVLGVGVLSPIATLALPTVAWRMLSTNPHHWAHNLQYDAILMPILFVSFIEVLARPVGATEGGR